MKKRMMEIEKEYIETFKNSHEFGTPEHQKDVKIRKALEKEIFNIIQKDGTEFFKKYFDYSEEEIKSCVHHLKFFLVDIFVDKVFNADAFETIDFDGWESL